MTTPDSRAPRAHRRSQERQQQGQGRGQRHRRRPARQVPAHRQVPRRRRAGAGRRLRLLRRRVRLGRRRPDLRQHHAHRLAARLSGRARAPRPGDAAQRAVGRQRAVLPRRVRQRRRHAVADLPAPDAEARARRAPRRSGFAPMCGMEFEWFNFAETPQSWAAKQRRRPGADHARHVRLLAAAHEPQARVLQRADGRDARLRRADRGPAHRDRAGRLRGRDRVRRGARAGRPLDPVQDRRQGDRRALRRSCRASWRSGTRSTRAAAATSTRA